MSSGDLGYFDEHGLLFVVGRDEDMIVSGGEKVSPAEVENVISGHPDVVEATALGVSDPEYGARLRAFVVKQEYSDLDEDAIKQYVREHLARYKVPREVVFLDELPRSSSGKLLRDVLAHGRTAPRSPGGERGGNS
jgi:fatty-acyl-CoA synthase